MSSVITFKHTWIKEGKLFHSDLVQIWKDEAFSGLQDLLLKLLEDFGVASHIRNHDPPYSLLPILMPDKRPSRTIAELWTPLPTPSQGSLLSPLSLHHLKYTDRLMSANMKQGWDDWGGLINSNSCLRGFLAN